MTLKELNLVVVILLSQFKNFMKKNTIIQIQF